MAICVLPSHGPSRGLPHCVSVPFKSWELDFSQKNLLENPTPILFNKILLNIFTTIRSTINVNPIIKNAIIEKRPAGTKERQDGKTDCFVGWLRHKTKLGGKRCLPRSFRNDLKNVVL